MSGNRRPIKNLSALAHADVMGIGAGLSRRPKYAAISANSRSSASCAFSSLDQDVQIVVRPRRRAATAATLDVA
jgi:hypothetical protein